MTPPPSPRSPSRLQVGAVVGVIVVAALGVWTISSLTSSGTPPPPSSGLGLASQLPGTSGGSLDANGSLLPGGSVAPGTSGSPGTSLAPGATPTKKPAGGPTPKPTPKVTPKPTAKPLTKIKLTTAYSGFSDPIFVTGAHDGTNRLFVVEQTGHIRVIVKGKTQSTDFLDIHSLVKFGGEQGLLGLAFNPSFRTNGYFYVYYNQTGSGNIMVARYTAAGGTNVASSGSAKPMISPIPHSQFDNHNGGMMAFGPNGLLYFGTGDGGSGGNPTGTAQSLSSYLGKMLRINVSSATPIKPTIWAYGLRNPWRWSFDSATGDMWIGDVGQDRYEEIDHVSKAHVLSSTRINFGWNIWEGRSCYPSGTGCSSHGITMPVAVYGHSLGCAVVGGYVYRGPVAGLRGNYFYGDDCSGRIWRLVAKAGNQTGVQVADTSLNISSFGTDDAGNEYVVSLGGTIYKIGL